MIDTYLREYKKTKPLAVNDEIKLKNYLQVISEDYLILFYGSKVWTLNKYKGIKTYKFPTDLWIFQEIIIEIKPDLIIETGVMDGGTTLFFADLLEYLGNGMVVGIDIEMNGNLPQHHRIKYIKGDSVSDEVINEVGQITKDKKVKVVDLDSCHEKIHVLNELKAYNGFVSIGSYLIVEDTIIGGHPVEVSDKQGKVIKPGPYEAVNEFLKSNTKFQIDKSRERFNLSTNINGYLKRL